MTQLLEPERRAPEAPPENGLVFGRPVEDRAFEAVEAGAGLAVGVAIGASFGGPAGAAIGALVGAIGGFVTGEVVERAAGLAARTTNAVQDDGEGDGDL